MVLKSVSVAVTCALLVAAGTAWAADDYRPGEYLNLDLSKAVLSPKRLGPPAEFAPLPIEARSDAKRVATERIVAAPAKVRVAEPPAGKPHRPARTKLAHRRSNPLDANAMYRPRSIQIWPCKSGGICNWKR